MTKKNEDPIAVEIIASMPIESVEEELLKLGLDPHKALPPETKLLIHTVNQRRQESARNRLSHIEEYTQSIRKDNKEVWGTKQNRFDKLCLNLSMYHLVPGIELIIGVLMIPFYVSYLGTSTYGLWALMASITAYFSMLSLGYEFGLIRVISNHRQRRDSEAINEIVSTLFVVFTAVGLVAYLIAIFLALNLGGMFNIITSEAATGQKALLIISAYVAIGFPISVFGGVVNGFHRHHVNGFIAIAICLIGAAANVAVLLAGYGLIEVIVTTISVRLLGYLAYSLTAYRVFPALRIRLHLFRKTRLPELNLSPYTLIINLASRLNYPAGILIVGAFSSTRAVAILAVAQSLIGIMEGFTHSLNVGLSPSIIGSSTPGERDRLQKVFLRNTQLSLAMAISIGLVLALLAGEIVTLWCRDLAYSMPVMYILAVAVTVRVGSTTATTLLKCAGRTRLVGVSNLLMGISSVILSIKLVQSLGVIGVALGTLIPLVAIYFFVLFPAACRWLNIPIGQAVLTGVWPALWPAFLIAGMLVVGRSYAFVIPISIAVQTITAGIVYGAIYLGLAISREDRGWILTNDKKISPRIVTDAAATQYLARTSA